jgi:hypothetical protein
MLGTFIKICQQIPILFEMGQKYPVIYKKTSVGFIVSGDTNLPSNRSLRVK